jgi:hypothetical protein
LSRRSILIPSVVTLGMLAAATPALASPDRPVSKHVLLLSVDGLHQADLERYVADHPDSALARLVHRGASFTNARTTSPSDSFPGMTAQLTGGGPGTTGVFYDDTFNHALFPAGTKTCSGAAPGAEVPFTEAADRSQSPITLDAGQGIDAAALKSLSTNTLQQTLANSSEITQAILRMTPAPQTLLDPAALPVDGTTCTPVYPHQYLRVNTVFEVARAHGMRTAWSDKHPAYEILNGPSGTGIQDLFAPEINGVADNSGDDWSTNNALTMEYDSTKVAAVLNEIDGYDHPRAHHVGTPTVFGMNFQTVSTAQKLPSSDGLTGGYLPNGQPGPLLARALNYINDRVGTMLTELGHEGLAGSTTVILSAKHGQSPVDPAQLRRVDDGAIIDNLNAAWKSARPSAPRPLVSFAVDDDGMLMWLSDRSQTAQDFAKTYLMNHTAPANRPGDPKGTFTATVPSSALTDVSTGAAADAAFGAATGDSHAPDLVGITQQGVVYTGNVKKIAEHGGEHPEDLNVPLVVAGAGATHAVNGLSVKTTQIAPTILRLLGLNPSALQAVRIEGTQVLPGIAH